MSQSLIDLSVKCVLALLAVVLVAGCAGSNPTVRVYNPGGIRPPVSPGSVELLKGKPNRKYTELGVVDSFRAKQLTPEETSQMMTDLQHKAASLGADAVIDVRRLADRHEGFVNNPRTPFPSVMQGEWKEYFFRGTAVRYGK
jgi:hypothetical protein